MERTIHCPGCDRAFRVPPGAEGKQTRCPDCQTKFRIEPESPDGSYSLAPPAEPETPAADTNARQEPGELAGASTYVRHGGIKRERPSKKPKAKPKTHTTGIAGRYAYLALSLLLLPLAWSLMLETDDAWSRLEHSVQANPQVEADLESQDFDSDAEAFEYLLRSLPGAKIEGAHLARDSWVHWVYGLLAGTFILGAVVTCFPRGNVKPVEPIVIAVGVSTAGVTLLILFQWIAEFSLAMPMTGGWIGTLIIGILKLIGFSYRSALDPEASFLLSFFGFTVGVGLCEEFTKAFPIIAYFRGDSELSWHGACIWGLASGVGFGVAEGIMYSADQYNGIQPLNIYLVRFLSCVTLHAVWGGTAALLAWRHQALLEGELDWDDWGQVLLFVLGIPMVLHGLYDTCLKMEYNAAALAVAVLSFGVLAALLEWGYREAD